jgi:Uma2 family endonuclease
MGTMTGLSSSGGFTVADRDALPAVGRRHELIDGLLVITSPAGLTREDRDDLDDRMPRDGRRSELIDGAIVVSPSPSTRHQDLVASLLVLLRARRTPDVKVMVAPFDVALPGASTLVPDLVVARRRDVTARDLPVAPLLAVEVLSPSTGWVDLGRKKDILAEAGCPSYWIVDPGRASTPPTLVVYELLDGGYVEVARVAGGESWTAERPFPVTITPRDLLDD